MKLGTAIRQIRKERGLSQGELCEKACISETSLSLIEMNKNRPHVNTLKRIGEALNVNYIIFYFIGIEVEDVAEDKHEVFKKMYPHALEILKELLM